MNQNRWLGAAAFCVLLGCGGTQTAGPKTDVNEKTDQLPGGWTAAPDEINQGDLKVRIVAVEVGSVIVKSTTDAEFKSTEETYLLVKLSLTNVREKKLPYIGWGSFAAQFGGNAATLTDERSKPYKIYKLKTFGQSAVVQGQLNSVNITRVKPRQDLLVFETPPSDVQVLLLELPGINYGHKEPILLRIERNP